MKSFFVIGSITFFCLFISCFAWADKEAEQVSNEEINSKIASLEQRIHSLEQEIKGYKKSCKKELTQIRKDLQNIVLYFNRSLENINQSMNQNSDTLED